jgi:N6-adenosine-specific RNA methylase IME4
MSEALTKSEQTELERWEAIIERGLNTFYEVGSALLTIRDKKLYRKNFSTFEEYCRDKWEFSTRHAYRLIESAEVIRNLRPIGHIPANEAQARELVPLESADQRLAWEVVLSTAPTGKNGQPLITAQHINSVVTVLSEIRDTGALEVGDGEMLPASQALKARVTEETYERLKRQETYIAEKLDANRRKKIEKVLIEAGGVTVIDKPSLRYPVILADPPWEYEFSKDDADAIENHYPTMSVEALCDLNVEDLTTEDAVLFLWATNPKLEEALEVITAWGFNYRTNACWDKEWIGPGYYFRSRHELLLVATKGALPVPRPQARPDSVIREKRTKHSKKPDQIYDLIESMYPELPKVELFARQARSGWSRWGNEVEVCL